MVNRERKLVTKHVDDFSFEYSTIGSLKKTLTRACKEYGNDATIESYYMHYDENKYFGIYAKVPETDEEMKTRIDNEEKYEQLADARDYEEFNRLQKKFGGSV